MEKLEQGAPVSNLLTFGLCFLSAGAGFLIALLGTPLPQLTFVLFLCTLLILAIAGAICTFFGWSLRINTKQLARQIRARMPDAPSIQQVPPDAVTALPPVQAASRLTSPAAAPPERFPPSTGQAEEGEP